MKLRLNTNKTSNIFSAITLMAVVSVAFSVVAVAHKISSYSKTK